MPAPEGLVDELGGGEEVGLVGVELGHHDRPRLVHLGTLGPQGGRDGVDAIGGTHHEHGPIGGPQPGTQVAAEVGMAGGVQQVDHHIGAGGVIVVADRGKRQGRGALGIVTFAAIARYAGPQEVLEQGGLARPCGADEHHIAQVGGGGNGSHRVRL